MKRLIWFPWLAAVLGNGVLLPLMMAAPSFRLILVTYTYNTLVLPPLFALCGLVAWARASRRVPIRRKAPGLLLFVAAALALTRVYCTHIEPRLLHVRRVEFASPKVTRPLKILHISDTQSDRVGRYEEKAFARMAGLEPDLVVFTGDLIQPRDRSDREQFAAIQSLITGLARVAPIVGVTGDTDYRLDNLGIKRIDGMVLLRNTTRIFDTGAGAVAVFGLSRTASGGQGARELVEKWQKTHDPGSLQVVAGHAPDYILSIDDLPVDLCLAGHTHGGQIRIPFYGPILTLSRVPREWARGFHRIGATRLNVTAGIGSEHADGLPAIRLFCPPEMTLITVTPASQP